MMEANENKNHSLKSFKVYKNMDHLKDDMKNCKSIALVSHVGKCWVCLKYKVKRVTLNELCFDSNAKKEINGCTFLKIIIGGLKLENISYQEMEEKCDAIVVAIPLMLSQQTFDEFYHCISSD